MKFNIPIVLLSIVVAAVVNLAIYYTFGPTAALIEAVPGGLFIGVFFTLLSMPRKGFSK